MLAGIQHLELKPWGIYPVLKNQHSFGGEDLFNTMAAYVNHAWGLDSRLHLSLYAPADRRSIINCKYSGKHFSIREIASKSHQRRYSRNLIPYQPELL